MQQGEIDKGLKILEKAMVDLSEVPEVRYHYAVALLKSGQEEKARSMLDKLVQSQQQFEGLDEARELLSN